MDRIKVAQLMEEQGLVPLFFHEDVETAKKVLEACYKGGARLMEFTNRGAFAHEIFSELSKFKNEHCPDMALGAGSVVDAATASLYMQCDASFIVTPVLREDIAIACNKRKILWSPGCATLTEIARAEELGCETVKLFPGGVYGPGFIKAIKAPQPWTKIMPTGGVTASEDNLRGWFEAGATCVGMGSKLVSKDIVAKGDFEGLTTKVAEVLKLIAQIRN